MTGSRPLRGALLAALLAGGGVLGASAGTAGGGGRAPHRPGRLAAVSPAHPRGTPPPPAQALLTARQAVGQAPGLPAGTTDLGPVPPEQPVSLEIALKPRDPAALSRFVTAVSTPGSPQYRHYLARGEFGPSFGASRQTVSDTLAAIRDLGLTPGAVSPNDLSVKATGTAAAAEAALSTTLHNYKLPDGERAFANTSAPRLPSAIAPSVQAVLGLDDLTRFHPLLQPQAQSSGAQAPVRTAVSAQPAAAAGYCPGAAGTNEYTAGDLASAYDFSGLYSKGVSGSGTTVAVYELSDVNPADVAAYQSCYGTSAQVSQVTVDTGGDNSIPNGPLEADADTETVAGLAPSSNILVYEAPNSDTVPAGPYDNWNQIVTDDRAQVVSTSWGSCESPTLGTSLSAAQYESTIFEQAAAQGQTVVAAAGDQGSEGCSPFSSALAVDDPASQPYVTGVGGTQLTIGPPQTETAWGGGGGGVSAFWTMPAWQQGPGVVSSYSSETPCGAQGSDCREVPDVSANAGPDKGYAVYYDGAWKPVYGTSLSTPLWGALMGLTDQYCGSGEPAGFANPALYRLAAQGGAGLHDVTTGNNGYFPATTGYDMATGLGSPDGAVLAPQLCSVPTVTGVSPPSGPTSGGNTVTVSGTGLSSPGTQSIVRFGSNEASSVSCSSIRCTASAPPGVAGTVDVTVQVGNLTSPTTAADTYSYLAPSGYTPVTPVRLADTRAGSGRQDSGHALGPLGQVNVQVAGTAGVPSKGVSAVVLNVTATDTTTSSYLTVYPEGSARPLASNLNLVGGGTVANLVEVPVGSGNGVTIFNANGFTDVVVDLEGYVSSTGAGMLQPMTPVRFADTRAGSGAQDAGDTLWPDGSLNVKIRGYAGIPQTATAVVLNLTVTDTTAATYLTAYPGGQTTPLASNLNVVAGQTLPNRVIVPIGPNGGISIFNAVGFDNVVVDVNGYFAPSGYGFSGMTPTRILDTRAGSPSPDRGSTLGPGGALQVQVAGVAGIPANAKAVVANVTSTDTSASSYLSIYPSGAARPTISDLNWSPGQTEPNLAVVKLGSNGAMTLYNAEGSANVIVDVVGWYS